MEQRIQMFAPEIGVQNVRLLYFVERHDFITSPQLARMRGMTERGVRYLLNRLASENYLDKTKIRSDQTRTYPYQYFITNKAKDLICENYEIPDKSMLVVRRNDEHKRIGINVLLHNLGVNDFFSRVIAQSKKLGPGVVLWATSRECCMPVPIVDAKIRPDGYAIIQMDSRYLHFVLEYDRGTERYSRNIYDKYIKYLKYAESEMYIYHFAFPDENIYFEEMPIVLFLTTTGGRAKNMKEYLELVAEKEGLEDVMKGTRFFFSCETKENMSDVMAKIWLRAGHGDELYSILD